jgi:hypothetical protein
VLISDRMKTVHGLHRIRCTMPNAVGVQGTSIATDDGDRRMLGQPGRHRRGRVVWQQIHDSIIGQIDHCGAITPAPAPRPLVEANVRV